MEALTWRTYRDAEACPVPVLRGQKGATCSWNAAELPDRMRRVQPFLEARGVDSGRTEEAGSRLSSTWMADEPILLTLDGQSADNPLGLSSGWARPERQRPAPTTYEAPALLDDALHVPGAARRGPEILRRLRARPRGAGVFQIPPGWRLVAGLRIGSQTLTTGYDYDPRHGALYVEQGGAALPTNVPLDVFVSEKVTDRIPLSTFEPGRSPVTASDETPLGVLTKEVRMEWTDARRLPPPDPELQWHATGRATYDGAPYGAGSLWIIETDASPERLREAVRRTLPAGVMYRQEPYSE